MKHSQHVLRLSNKSNAVERMITIKINKILIHQSKRQGYHQQQNVTVSKSGLDTEIRI